jgi:hypothetical protein
LGNDYGGARLHKEVQTSRKLLDSMITEKFGCPQKMGVAL